MFTVLLLFQLLAGRGRLDPHAMVRAIYVRVCECVPLKFTFSFASSDDFWPFTIIFFPFTLAANLQWKLRIKLIFSLFEV